MDRATLAPFAWHSWLMFRVAGPPGGGLASYHMRGVAHAISLTVRGRQTVRWITGSRERTWTETAGAVHFRPADGERHTFVTAMGPGFESAVCFIPRGHLRACLTSEGYDHFPNLRRILAPADPVLQSSMARVARGLLAAGERTGADVEEAARRLVLRLAELCGASPPDWQADAAVFPRRTLESLVSYIDAHLRIAPSLVDMGLQVGLSPSHFAKKFRQSTGLSLQRFINRRRLQRSLEMLKDRSQSVASVALDLGFASQSHFTRLFSDQTGMTPAKYGRQSRPTVG